VASIAAKFGIEIGRNFPQFWAQVSQFLTQVFFLHFGLFPLHGKKFGYKCIEKWGKVKSRGKVLLWRNGKIRGSKKRGQSFVKGVD